MNKEHGDRKILTLTVDNGRGKVDKPARFCSRHGYVFEFQWKEHKHCDRKPEVIEFTPQTLAKAA